MTGTRCAVYGCDITYYSKHTSSGDTIILHSFPKSKNILSRAIRDEWIRRCRRGDTFNPVTSRICSLHFTEGDYERDLQNELLGLPSRRVLKKTALPSLRLDFKQEGVKTNLENNHAELARRKKREATNSVITTCLPSNENPLETLDNSENNIFLVELPSPQSSQEVTMVATDIRKYVEETNATFNQRAPVRREEEHNTNLASSYALPSSENPLRNLHKVENEASRREVSPPQLPYKVNCNEASAVAVNNGKLVTNTYETHDQAVSVKIEEEEETNVVPSYVLPRSENPLKDPRNWRNEASKREISSLQSLEKVNCEEVTMVTKDNIKSVAIACASQDQPVLVKQEETNIVPSCVLPRNDNPLKDTHGTSRGEISSPQSSQKVNSVGVTTVTIDSKRSLIKTYLRRDRKASAQRKKQQQLESAQNENCDKVTIVTVDTPKPRASEHTMPVKGKEQEEINPVEAYALPSSESPLKGPDYKGQISSPQSIQNRNYGEVTITVDKKKPETETNLVQTSALPCSENLLQDPDYLKNEAFKQKTASPHSIQNGNCGEVTVTVDKKKPETETTGSSDNATTVKGKKQEETNLVQTYALPSSENLLKDPDYWKNEAFKRKTSSPQSTQNGNCGEVTVTVDKKKPGPSDHTTPVKGKKEEETNIVQTYALPSSENPFKDPDYWKNEAFKRKTSAPQSAQNGNCGEVTVTVDKRKPETETTGSSDHTPVKGKKQEETNLVQTYALPSSETLLKDPDCLKNEAFQRKTSSPQSTQDGNCGEVTVTVDKKKSETETTGSSDHTTPNKGKEQEETNLVQTYALPSSENLLKYPDCLKNEAFNIKIHSPQSTPNRNCAADINITNDHTTPVKAKKQEETNLVQTSALPCSENLLQDPAYLKNEAFKQKTASPHSIQNGNCGEFTVIVDKKKPETEATGYSDHTTPVKGKKQEETDLVETYTLSSSENPLKHEAFRTDIPSPQSTQNRNCAADINATNHHIESVKRKKQEETNLVQGYVLPSSEKPLNDPAYLKNGAFKRKIPSPQSIQNGNCGEVATDVTTDHVIPVKRKKQEEINLVQGYSLPSKEMPLKDPDDLKNDAFMGKISSSQSTQTRNCGDITIATVDKKKSITNMNAISDHAGYVKRMQDETCVLHSSENTLKVLYNLRKEASRRRTCSPQFPQKVNHKKAAAAPLFTRKPVIIKTYKTHNSTPVKRAKLEQTNQASVCVLSSSENFLKEPHHNLNNEVAIREVSSPRSTKNGNLVEIAIGRVDKKKPTNATNDHTTSLEETNLSPAFILRSNKNPLKDPHNLINGASRRETYSPQSPQRVNFEDVTTSTIDNRKDVNKSNMINNHITPVKVNKQKEITLVHAYALSSIGNPLKNGVATLKGKISSPQSAQNRNLEVTIATVNKKKPITDTNLHNLDNGASRRETSLPQSPLKVNFKDVTSGTTDNRNDSRKCIASHDHTASVKKKRQEKINLVSVHVLCHSESALGDLQKECSRREITLPHPLPEDIKMATVDKNKPVTGSSVIHHPTASVKTKKQETNLVPACFLPTSKNPLKDTYNLENQSFRREISFPKSSKNITYEEFSKLKRMQRKDTYLIPTCVLPRSTNPLGDPPNLTNEAFRREMPCQSSQNINYEEKYRELLTKYNILHSDYALLKRRYFYKTKELRYFQIRSNGRSKL